MTDGRVQGRGANGGRKQHWMSLAVVTVTSPHTHNDFELSVLPSGPRSPADLDVAHESSQLAIAVPSRVGG